MEIERSFDTKAERDAYILGIKDAEAIYIDRMQKLGIMTKEGK